MASNSTRIIDLNDIRIITLLKGIKYYNTESKILSENCQTKIIETINLKFTQFKINDINLRIRQLETKINALDPNLSRLEDMFEQIM